MKIITLKFEGLLRDFRRGSQKANFQAKVLAKLYNNRWYAKWFLIEYDVNSKKAFAYGIGQRWAGGRTGEMKKRNKGQFEEIDLSVLEKSDLIEVDWSFRPKKLSEALQEDREQREREPNKPQNSELAV